MREYTRIQVPQVMEYQCTNGLKGQQALSPGQRPGYQQTPTFALKGQKPYESDMLLPFQGEGVITVLTQGDALGYGLLALQAESAQLRAFWPFRPLAAHVFHELAKFE